MNTPESEPISSATGENMLADQIYPSVAALAFFKGMTEPQLQLLAASAMQVTFQPGESILREGEPANRFYLILEGRVELASEVKEHNHLPVHTLGPGDNLGWSWLFPPYYLHFSAHALEPVKAIFFYGTRVRQQCEEDHELGYQLMKRVAEALIQNLTATKEQLLEYADAKSLPAELQPPIEL